MRDLPEPVPNSEVKPRSVLNVSVVFGHAKLRKLAAYPFWEQLMDEREILKLYYQPYRVSEGGY